MRDIRRPSWRTLRAGAICAVASLLLAALLAPTAARAATTAWRADGFGPQNTGFNPNETAITAATVGRLAYRWSITAPVVRLAEARQGPPVVAGGKLYLSDPAGVGAYNATTGAALWHFNYPDPTDATTPKLAIVGSQLFVGWTGAQSVSDPGGALFVLNAATGAVVWKLSAPVSVDSMVVDKGVVVFSGNGDLADRTFGYRAGTGEKLWERDGALARPVSANGRLLVTRTDPDDRGSDLVAIATGAPLWSSPTQWSILASGKAGGPLYAQGPLGELARLNVETGAVAWSVPGAASASRPEVAVDDARVYVASDKDLTARDPATGAQVWTRHFFSALGRPVVAGGVLYATVNGATMYPLDAETGRTADDYPPFEDAVAHPVIVNGWLHVTSGRVLDAYRIG